MFSTFYYRNDSIREPDEWCCCNSRKHINSGVQGQHLSCAIRNWVAYPDGTGLQGEENALGMRKFGSDYLEGNKALEGWGNAIGWGLKAVC